MTCRTSLVAIVVFSCVACWASDDSFAQMHLNVDFDQYTAEAVYTDNELDNDFNSPPWEDGVDEGRVSIVTGSEAFGGTGASLKVSYPAGEHGTKKTGGQWKAFLPAPVDEAYLSYRVKFGAGFDFVRGGKLPGLAGGTAPTGNTTADGTNGWTGRMMWRTEFDGVSGQPEQLTSNAISYAKYVGSGANGDGQDEDKIYWVGADGNQTTINSDVWYQILQRVKMNTPGSSDGILQIWLDGELVHEQTDIVFRTNDSFSIDQVYFSTFFGGNSDWKTSQDEFVYFDDFQVTTPRPRFFRVPLEFPTVQAAVDGVYPGEAVVVRGGDWNGNVVIDKPLTMFGTTASRLIATDANQPALTVSSANVDLKRLKICGGSVGVKLMPNSVNVDISYFRVSESGIGIEAADDCNNLQLRYCEVNDNQTDGIVANNCADLLLLGSECNDNGGSGAKFVNCDRTDLIRNDALRNGANGFELTGSDGRVQTNWAELNGGIGFLLSGDRAFVVRNESRSNGATGMLMFDADEMMLLTNKSRYNVGAGFQFNNVKNSDMRANLGRRNAMVGFDFLNSRDNLVIENLGNANDLTGIFLDATTMDNEVTDNVARYNRSGGGIVDNGSNNVLSGNIVTNNF